jgi:AcrR family transcriptional regulator
MARQARSEATRQKIIDVAAVDLFDEIGYTTTGMGDIIECAQISKGARYHHFDSKEPVAAAVIQIGGRCGMVARSRSRFSSGVTGKFSRETSCLRPHNARDWFILSRVCWSADEDTMELQWSYGYQIG